MSAPMLGGLARTASMGPPRQPLGYTLARIIRPMFNIENHEPKWAAIVAGSSGVNELVAAVTGKSIYPIYICLVAAGAVNIAFLSHGGAYHFASNADKAPLAAAGSGLAMGCPKGLWKGTQGEALEINLSGAVKVTGCIVYVEA